MHRYDANWICTGFGIAYDLSEAELYGNNGALAIYWLAS